MTTTGCIFPLMFCWKAEFLSVRLILTTVGIPKTCAPGAKSFSHFPVYPNYRIIIKGRMPEIITGKRLIVAIGKIADPNQGIRIDTDLFAINDFITLALKGLAGCFSPVFPLIFVHELTGIQLFLIGEYVITGEIHPIQEVIRPVNFIFPIDRLIAILIFLEMIQGGMSYRIPNIIDELAVFIIGDFSIIHKETHDGDLEGPLRKRVEDILVGLANME